MKKPTRIKKLDKKIEKKNAEKKKTLHGKLMRIPGIDKGKAVIKPDFDSPLPEFES
jgi:phosphoenolpyruvate synthase/pyruvate phosphate dikinase